MERCAYRTLVGESIALMEYTLYARSIRPYFITQKPRHSVYVNPNDEFSAFELNYTSTSFCNNFSRAIKWSMNEFLFINSSSYIYTLTISKPPNTLVIFSWETSGLLQPPKVSFWNSYSPTGVKYYTPVCLQGISRYDNNPRLTLTMKYT